MENDYSIPWYDIDWFTPSTLRSFTWEHKEYFYAFIGIVALFVIRWLLRYNFNQKLPVAVTQKELKVSFLNLVRLIPEIILMIVLALMVLALARPQKTNEKVEQWTEGIDIMLALDISKSMQMEDFVPNRLEAAKNVGRNFINGRKQDRIGLVVFSGDAFSLTPLTTDYDLLKSYLNNLNFDMIEKTGTAIGSAIGVVTNRMRESNSKSKVCILLSDGSNNAGNLDPIAATKLASAFGIKIYTIIVGKEGLVPYGKDIFGRTQMVENEIDESIMREIAKLSDGEFFRVTDNQALSQVFKRIDKYEKAEIKETRFKNTADYYYIYLYWAISLFLIWMLLKSTFITNVLQD